MVGGGEGDRRRKADEKKKSAEKKKTAEKTPPRTASNIKGVDHDMAQKILDQLVEL